MKRFTVIAAAFVVLALGASNAQAVVVFQDNFDGYADQTAFTTVWQPIGCQGQGGPCTLNATSTTSNELNAADFAGDPAHLQTMLNHSPPATSPGTADLAERNQITFPASPTLANGDKLSFSYDFYDLAPTGSPFRQFVNLQSSLAVGTSPAGQLVAMGLNNSQDGAASGGQYYMGRVLGYTVTPTDPDGGPNEAGQFVTIGAGSFFKMNDFSTGIGTGPGARSAGWHNLKVVISTSDSGATTDYNFYVDGQRAEHINQAGAPRTYTALRMGAGVSATNDAYFDNFLLEYIPAAAGLPGDFNNDGHVDAGDYVSIRHQNSDITTGAGLTAYTAWRTNFGVPPGSGSGLSGGAVPEPASIALLLSSFGFVFAGRRRVR